MTTEEAPRAALLRIAVIRSIETETESCMGDGGGRKIFLLTCTP